MKTGFEDKVEHSTEGNLICCDRFNFINSSIDYCE